MAEETKKKLQHEEKSLEKMTVKELREIALQIPHAKAVHDMKKDEMIALIKAAREIKDEKPGKQKKKIIKIKMTKPELKAKIRELKKLKLQALDEHNSNLANVLRHRISRMKKESRHFASV